MRSRTDLCRCAAVIVCVTGLAARRASADVYITEGSGTQVNHYRDDGSLILALPQFWGEGIYDFTHTSDGTLVGAANTLGAVDTGHYNPNASVPFNLPSSFLLAGGSPLIRAGAPIAGGRDHALFVGVNTYFSPPVLPTAIPEHSIVRIDVRTGALSTAVQFDSTLAPMSELQVAPDGTLFARFTDDVVRRIDVDGTRQIIATGVKHLSVDSRDGRLALLDANNQIVAADPVTGTTLGVLVPQASLDGTPITDFTFGPGNTMLVGTAGLLADHTFTVQSFNLDDGSHRLFASTYSVFGGGAVEYVVPEPVSLVMLSLAAPCVMRRRRRR